MAVAFVASATATNTSGTDATNVTVTKPTGTLDGHLMIAVTHGYTSDTFTAPSGWTFLAFKDDSTGLRSRAYWKIASSEGASYLWTFQPGAGGGAIGVSISTFSGHGGLDRWASAVDSTTDPVDDTFISIAALRNGMNYAVYCWRDTTADTVTWTGNTERFDVNAGDAGLTQYRGQSGSTGTVTPGSLSVWTANPTNSVTHGISWQFYIADAVTNETWASTGQAVELQVNGTWTDVTGDVRYDNAVNIIRGTNAQGGQVNPSNATFTLDNIAGKYSVLNPTSPYYPYLGLSVPCRISKAYGTVAAEFLGFYDILGNDSQPVDRFRTASSDALNITGDIDIRVDVEPETWKYQQVLVAKHEEAPLTGISVDSNQQGWVFYLNSDGVPIFSWVDGTIDNRFVATATTAVRSNIRQAIRVTLDVNNGAGGYTVTFYTSDTLSGSWTQLGSTVVGTATTSIASNRIALNVGAIEPQFYGQAITFYDREVARTTSNEPVIPPFRGRIYGMELKNGIAGTTVAKPDFTAQTTGTYSFTDSNSNFWSAFGYVVCHNRKYRHHGEITSWPQPRDTTGNNAWVDIESTGLLNRYQQGTPEEKSALNHFYSDPYGVTQTYTNLNYTLGSFGPYNPIGYWSLEDNALPNTEDPQDVAGSSLSIQKPGTVFGTVEFGADGSFYGAKSATRFTTGSLIKFPIVGAADSNSANGNITGAWCVEFLLYAPNGITNGASICEVRQTGTNRIIRLVYTATDTVTLAVLTEDRTVVATTGALSIPINAKHNKIMIYGKADTYFLFYEVPASRTATFVDSVAGGGGTTGRIYEVVLSANQLMNDVYVAHLAAFDATNAGGEPYGAGYTYGAQYTSTALDAWRVEPAATRAERLTWQQELVNYNIGDGGPQMGIQGTKNYVDLMQEVQTTDMGYVYEPRNVLGMGYRTRASMYNAPAMLTLSYTGDDLSGSFSPVKDNRITTNDATVTNSSGSFARYELTSGNMSVNNPPNGIGRYRSEETVSLFNSTDLSRNAEWRVFIGTNQDLRVDTITLALENPRIGGVADNIYRFLTADIGDRISLTDLPLLLQPDDMELTIIGYSETFDQFQHSITFNCVPGSIFAVGNTVITTSTTASKADSLTTTLNEDLDTTETGVDVAITSGSALWTTSGVDFDIIVGGERMTVTSVSGSSSPQTFTVTRSVNGVVKTHSTGAQVKLFRPAIAGL